MLEKLSDALKASMRDWSTRLAGDKAPRLAAIKRPDSEYHVDPFGFDVDYAVAAAAPFIWLYKHYFRVETFGIDKVRDGRTLFVGNHSGQLPMDAAMILVALLLEANPPRVVRSMTEKWAATLPFVSTLFARSGQIIGTPENCRRILQGGDSVMVFPEGVRGLSKLWPQRYQLQEFGLGFMRLALETDTPVVPVAVIGAEEQSPSLLDLKSVGKLMGFPALPLTVTGLPLPLPTKYRLHFGEAMRFSGRADDEDAELDKKVRRVRSTLQQMIEDGLKERKHVFW